MTARLPRGRRYRRSNARQWPNTMAEMPEIEPKGASDTTGRPLARPDRGAAEAGVRRTTEPVMPRSSLSSPYPIGAERFSDRGRIWRCDRSTQAKTARRILHMTIRAPATSVPNAQLALHLAKTRTAETTDHSTRHERRRIGSCRGACARTGASITRPLTNGLRSLTRHCVASTG